MDSNAKKSAIVALFLSGKSNGEIVKELRPLNVSRFFVYRTIKRYSETGSIERKLGSGGQVTALTPENIRKVKQRLQREPRRSGNKIAKDIGISQSSIRRVFKNELHVKPYKIQKVQELTISQKKVRLDKAKELKALLARSELKNIVFSDEKIFTIMQYVNKQNDRVYLSDRSTMNLDHLRAYRKQRPASVMVWAGVTQNGRTPLVFVPMGVKINAESYRELILEGCLKPWATKLFKKNRYVFQQVSAPAHRAKITQEWLKKHVPAFIPPSLWPPCSPDLNPLDFCVWGILESKVSSKKYETLDGLKRALTREWAKIPQDVLRAACDSFDSFERRLY